MRTDFVANASHELRTPLASLSGFIETLKGPARDDAAARARFLDIMQEQARRMSRLIDDLLSLSRIETRRRLRPNEVADIADVLRSVARQLRPQAEESGMNVQLVGLDGDGVLVNGDRDELIQVFANLFENALKYGSDGRRVEIGLRRDGEGVEAYVRDFGKGIGAEHVPRLTERFYRVEEGRRASPARASACPSCGTSSPATGLAFPSSRSPERAPRSRSASRDSSKGRIKRSVFSDMVCHKSYAFLSYRSCAGPLDRAANRCRRLACPAVRP